MAKKIPLNQEKFALVDDEDFEFLSQWKWRLTQFGYAFRQEIIKKSKPRKTKVHRMHRQIMGNPPKGIDHINGNKLDNRKENLRLANQSENMANSQKKMAASSKFKGVYLHKTSKKFGAHITVNYQRKFLGLFLCEKDAALAYNFAALEHFGEFARLNVVD